MCGVFGGGRVGSIVGRTLTERDNGWAVGLFAPSMDREVGVRLRRDGTVEVGTFLWGHQPTPLVTRLGPIRHPAIKPGDEFNKLLVILRGGQRLEIYVNDTAICQPIQLAQPLAPVFPALGLWERSGHFQLKGHVEFKRFTVWQLPQAAQASR